MRLYQSEIIHQSRLFLRKNDGVLIQAATGAGKTRIAVEILDKAAKKGNSGLFLVHRRELIKQTVAAFLEQGIETGVISAGLPELVKPDKEIQICSVQTLFTILKKNKSALFNKLFDKEIKLLIKKISDPKLIIIDEAHHVKARTWEFIIDFYKKREVKNIGLSATPLRTDKKGIGDIYDFIVKGPKIKWLIENGFLAGYRYFAPEMFEMNKISHAGGDFNKKEIEIKLKEKAIYGKGVKYYEKYGKGKQAIVFCASIKSSLESLESFKKAGYNCAHIDCGLSYIERDQIIEDFKSKKINILFSVDLVGEGFDVPGIEIMIDQRPTESLIIYLQHIGRVLRPAPGKKEAIIIDQVGNYSRHGLPDFEHDWRLDTIKKRKKNIEANIIVRVCSQCFFVHRPASKCPSCGLIYEIKTTEIKIVENEELIEINKSYQDKLEKTSCRTLEELIIFAKKKGYKENWAYRLFNYRQQKRKNKYD